MKKPLALLLAVTILLGITSVPAGALSSSNFQTFPYGTGSSYTPVSGLKYDFSAKGALILRTADYKSQEFQAGDPNPAVFRKDTGMVYVRFQIHGVEDHGEDTAWAFSSDYPALKVYLDDALIADTKRYAELRTECFRRNRSVPNAGWTVLNARSAIVCDAIDGNLYQYDNGWDVSTDGVAKIAFDTRKLDPGKHTLRIVLNPDFLSEEENQDNNEHIRTVCIKTDGPAAPPPPTLYRTGSSQININEIPGQEYSIDGGSTWQTGGTFSGLSPETSYQIITRIAETESAMASDSSAPLTVTTKPLAPDAPPAPLLQSKTAAAITVQTVSGLEYSIDYGTSWQDSGLFSGLSPNTMYQIAARVKATAEMPCSDRSAFLNVTTDKLSADAPAAPVLEQKTDTSISIRHIVGAEYSIDGGSSWQTSPSFTGLNPNTVYAITARFAETGSSYASPASPALFCKTKRTASVAPDTPRLVLKSACEIVISANFS